MEMVEKTGVCRFCGQKKFLEVPDYMTDEEVNEEASTECYCKEAKAYKEKKERAELIEQAKTSAKGTTHILFHEEFPEIEELFNAAINPLVDKKIKKLTITTGGKTKATISFSKDNIKVEREDKSVNTLETEI